MLTNREEIFENYDEDGFLTAFDSRIQLQDSIKDSERTLYLMRAK